MFISLTFHGSWPNLVAVWGNHQGEYCYRKLKEAGKDGKKKRAKQKTLPEKYPPSEPCACEICLCYCIRPGWWTVEEATLALEAGYGNRMMLEIAPELTFGVLSPAFKGCEKSFATHQFAKQWL